MSAYGFCDVVFMFCGVAERFHFFFFFFNDPPTTEISPFPLPDALPILPARLPAAFFISAGFASLRRCIFRGRQVAPPRPPLLRASATVASAPAPPTATAAAIPATV